MKEKVYIASPVPVHVVFKNPQVNTWLQSGIGISATTRTKLKKKVHMLNGSIEAALDESFLW